MKKSKVQLLVLLCLALIVMALDYGSRSKTQNTNEAPQKETSKDETKTNDKKEKHTLEGTLADKKDFMFVVEDDEKNPNAFAFSEKPKGYDVCLYGDCKGAG